MAQLQESGVLSSASVVAEVGVNTTSLSPTIFLAGSSEEDEVFSGSDDLRVGCVVDCVLMTTDYRALCFQDDYFTGCIDKVVINNMQLPLLLPDNGSVSTCGPRSAHKCQLSAITMQW